MRDKFSRFHGKIAKINPSINSAARNSPALISTKKVSKQQALDTDPKAIQQINFTRNVEQQATIFFIIEEA